MTNPVSRRTFVKTTAAVAAGTALASSSAIGANDRIRMAFIGVGNRGNDLMAAAASQRDVQVVALCDVYEPVLKERADQLGGNVDVYRDFRQVLDRNDIDAVAIATPDHWHAIQTVDACDAGKDVFVEKPLSITIHEGRRMVEAARRNQRVVQVGTHRRSAKMYIELAERIQDGLIGKVTVARSYRVSNMWPNGIGKAVDAQQPPADLDWDLWLGPRPLRPWRDNICPYKFRWWQAFSSQLGNWGVHFLDAIRWMLDEQAPESIVALGGRFAVDDDRTIPDTLEVTYQLPSGCLVIFGQYEATGTPALQRGYMELRGTLGTIYIDDRGYQIIPSGGGQFQKPDLRMEPMEIKSEKTDLTADHMRNFLDCVKTRQNPSADVEIGHRSTTFSHLGNIALATKARIEWDAANERIIGNDEANQMLHYEYRPPWKLA